MKFVCDKCLRFFKGEQLYRVLSDAPLVERDCIHDEILCTNLCPECMDKVFKFITGDKSK